MNLLGETTCRGCSGYGHTHKHCPTYARISQISGSRGVKSAINEARVLLNISREKTRGTGNNPAHSAIPYKRFKSGAATGASSQP